MFGHKKSYSPTERFDYLQKLIHEFNVSNRIDSRRQVLANLCSFAYNPINFEALNRLNVIPLLFEVLDQNDRTLTEFAVSGLCNLCVDPFNNYKIYNENGFNRINKILENNKSEDKLMIAGLTLLVYGKHFQQNISDSLRTTVSLNVKNIRETTANSRIKNLSSIYLMIGD